MEVNTNSLSIIQIIARSVVRCYESFGEIYEPMSFHAKLETMYLECMYWFCTGIFNSSVYSLSSFKPTLTLRGTFDWRQCAAERTHLGNKTQFYSRVLPVIFSIEFEWIPVTYQYSATNMSIFISIYSCEEFEFSWFACDAFYDAGLDIKSIDGSQWQ